MTLLFGDEPLYVQNKFFYVGRRGASLYVRRRGANVEWSPTFFPLIGSFFIRIFHVAPRRPPLARKYSKIIMSSNDGRATNSFTFTSTTPPLYNRPLATKAVNAARPHTVVVVAIAVVTSHSREREKEKRERKGVIVVVIIRASKRERERVERGRARESEREGELMHATIN